MGRYYWSKKTEADRLKKIQNWWLKKYGYFKSNWSSGVIKWTNDWSQKETSVGISVTINEFEKYLNIYYTQTNESGDKKDFDYKIPLATTPCYFGGFRYWFICPWYTNGIYCGRRVGVLYLGGDYFACRHCYALTYKSRNETNNPLFSALDVVLKSDEISKKQAGLRVKMWKGRPTKRYTKLEGQGWKLLAKASLLSPLIDGLEKKSNL